MIFTIDNLEFNMRDCQDEDYSFVLNLLKENMLSSFIKHWGEWNPESFKKGFKKENIKIIEHKSAPVACYDIKFQESRSYINNIQVSKSLQGKGLGSFLMNLMEKETKEHNLDKIRLKVFKDTLALNLYIKLGYKQITDEGSSVILEKSL
jgi:ribosomal protein S18 acetylase RimI-like enzyme